jgi:Cu2+-exporting ATPase
MVTGEANPVEKNAKSSVIAGSVNGSGILKVRVSRLPGDNTISAIAGMVDEAMLSKPRTQELADQVAGYFVPVIVIITVITLVIWVAVGVAVRKQSAGNAVGQATTFAIAVLIVSCPCAIGLAVPMVIVIAGGVAAERGVIFKTAGAIESAYRTSHVIFDKTGTLTQGKLYVSSEEYVSDPEGETTAILLGLVSNIKHPVSAAVAKHLKIQGIVAASVDDIKTVAGKGVEGSWNGLAICAGNSRWLHVESDPKVQSLLSQDFSVFCLLIDNQLRAIFGLKDSLRPDAPATISALKARDIAISIVSGDDEGAVLSVASKLGIPATNVKSRCTPTDKQEYVKKLMEDMSLSSKRNTKAKESKVVLFCGDGTNDAIALAQASIGVHMNEGTDVAQCAADVVLMRPSLGGILVLMDLSRAAVRRIVFNFAWAFVYNLFAILLAAGAFVKGRIPPAYAGLGEIVSVLPVILIALQMKKTRVGKA